jgi:hypothetical protein
LHPRNLAVRRAKILTQELCDASSSKIPSRDEELDQKYSLLRPKAHTGQHALPEKHMPWNCKNGCHCKYQFIEHTAWYPMQTSYQKLALLSEREKTNTW